MIAERMLAAKTTAAHTYAFFEIDVTKLVAARQTMLDKAAAIGAKVSLIALEVVGAVMEAAKGIVGKPIHI